jgi:hypothetical protein
MGQHTLIKIAFSSAVFLITMDTLKAQNTDFKKLPVKGRICPIPDGRTKKQLRAIVPLF